MFVDYKRETTRSLWSLLYSDSSLYFAWWSSQLDPAPEKLAFKSPVQRREIVEIQKEENAIFDAIEKPVELLKEGTYEFDFFNQRENVKVMPRIENQIKRREQSFKPWQMRKYVRIVCDGQLMNKTGEKVKDGKDKLLLAITGRMFKKGEVCNWDEGDDKCCTNRYVLGEKREIGRVIRRSEMRMSSALANPDGKVGWEVDPHVYTVFYPRDGYHFWREVNKDETLKSLFREKGHGAKRRFMQAVEEYCFNSVEVCEH